MSSLERVCRLNDTGSGYLECTGGSMAAIETVPLTVGPVLIPATGPAGRTAFNVTFDNAAEPALSNTRYNELQGDITNYLTDFAAQLGPMRDTGSAANAILVNTHITFMSLTTSYRATLEYTTTLNPALSGASRWVITITKLHSPGVFVKQIVLIYSDPNQANIVFACKVNSGTRAFQCNSQSNSSLNWPAGDFICPNVCEFAWNFNPPMGSTATINLGGINLFIDTYVTSQGTPAQNTLFYVNPTPAWVLAAANPNDTGDNILAQAGPTYLATFQQTDNIQSVPGLWNPTGPSLPVPTTPMVALGAQTNGTTPVILGSQWKFMRVYPEFAPYKASLDAAFAPATYDIDMQINTDFSRLEIATNFYSFPNSANYTSTSPSLYVFKSVLVHELMHGLGFIQGVAVGTEDANKYAVNLFNHYFFVSQPPNAPAFQSNQRTIASVATGNWISNGADINAPINPSSPSHLASNSGLNGLMEAALFPGSSPTGGPSAFDWDVLLTGQVANAEQALCVREDTLVLTQQGEKQIKDLQLGDMIQDYKRQWIPVCGIVKLKMWENFILLPRNCLGLNEPSQDLYIRPGHPILYGGKEVLPETLVGAQQILKSSCCSQCRETVYSIVSEDRTFVYMHGLLVGTWSQAAWENFKSNR